MGINNYIMNSEQKLIRLTKKYSIFNLKIENYYYCY